MTTIPAATYAAIYARVSTEDQGKGFSIPTQIEACQKLAEREGYTIPETHVLSDEGLSGTTMDPPRLTPSARAGERQGHRRDDRL
jgi:DNA invertase Pin-like site-specific DNA recombinase